MEDRFRVDRMWRLWTPRWMWRTPPVEVVDPRVEIERLYIGRRGGWWVVFGDDVDGVHGGGEA